MSVGLGSEWELVGPAPEQRSSPLGSEWELVGPAPLVSEVESAKQEEEVQQYRRELLANQRELKQLERTPEDVSPNMEMVAGLEERKGEINRLLGVKKWGGRIGGPLAKFAMNRVLSEEQGEKYQQEVVAIDRELKRLAGPRKFALEERNKQIGRAMPSGKFDPNYFQKAMTEVAEKGVKALSDTDQRTVLAFQIGEYVPFGGLGGAVAQHWGINAAAKRIEAGNPTRDDYKLVAWLVQRQQADQEQGVVGQAAWALAKMPKYITEIAVTGPVAKGVQAATIGRLGLAGSRALGGAAWIATNPGMIAQAAAPRLAAEIQVGKDQHENLQVLVDSSKADGYVEALARGIGSTGVQLLSEVSGTHLVNLLGKVMSKPAAALLGKLPVPARVTALKAATVSLWAKKTQGTIPQLLGRIGGAVKWDGAFGEILEERAAEIGEAVLGNQPWPDYLSKRFLKQLGSEALLFGTMGLPGFAGRVGAARWQRKMEEVTKFYVTDPSGPAKYAQTNPVGAAKLAAMPPEHVPSRGEWEDAGLKSLEGIGGSARTEFLAKVQAILQEPTAQAQQGGPAVSPKFLAAAQAARQTQEQSDAQRIEEGAQVDVGGGPRMETQVPEGPEQEGGEPLPGGRREGEEVPGEEAKAPPGEVGPRNVPVAPGEPIAPEAAQEPPLPPGPPVAAPGPPPAPDPTVALNKASVAEIWDRLGFGELPPTKRQSMQGILDQAAETKADESALETAGDVLRNPRALTPVEHAGMVLKYGKLEKELAAAREASALAADRDDTIGSQQETIRAEGILAQIEAVTEAAEVGSPQASAGLWIRKLRLSAQDLSLARVLQSKRAMKGSRLSAEETAKTERQTNELTAALEEARVQLEKDAARIAELEAADAARIIEKEVGKAKRERKGARGRQTIQAKLMGERAEIKAAIRALGYRVNELTGVSAEGSWLIGRLAINYIRGGAMTLADTTRMVLGDIPDLNQQDVYHALNAQNPATERRVRSDIRKRIAQQKSQGLVLERLDQITQELEWERRPARVEPTETVELRKQRRKLERRLGLEEKLEQLRAGTVPATKKAGVESPVIAAIKKEIRDTQVKLRLAKKITQAEKGELPGKKSKKVETPEIQALRTRLSELRQLLLLQSKIQQAKQGVFALRKHRTTPEAIRVLQKVLRDLRRQAYSSELEGEQLQRVVLTLNKLQVQLATGARTLKTKRLSDWPDVAVVKEGIARVRHEMRVDDTLADLQEQLRTKKYKVALRPVRKPITPELERKQIQIARLRKEIRNSIEEMAPWTKGKIGREILDTLRTMRATGDISFTFRQNAVLTLSHPILAGKNMVPALHAMFSQYKADQISNSLRNSPNGLHYDLSKLALMDVDSHVPSQNEEVFRGRLLQWVPGLASIIRGSNRHATCFSNLMRASVFDHFLQSVPNATPEEMKVYANFLNVATGLGDMGSLGNATNALSLIFFAPRLTVSRFQTPYRVYQIMRTQPRVRKAVARDMAGFVATGGTVLTLARLAGASVSGNPEDPDFGKIRIGDRRFDIWGGFQQPARLMTRIGLAAVRGVTRSSEELRKLTKEQDWVEFSSQFVIYKSAPIITLGRELATRKTAVGEPTTVPGILARSVTFMWMEDVWDAYKQYGVVGAAETLPPAISGIGVQTYKDSQTVTRRKIAEFKSAKKYEEAGALQRQWNIANPKNRIVTVKVPAK
jgi:hypothetical protein